MKNKNEILADDEIREDSSGENRVMKKDEFIEDYGEKEWYSKKWRLVKDHWKWNGWVSAKSITFQDTPKSLYRFLYVWEPKAIDFSDMYKSPPLALIDLNGKGLVSISLFKYELSAYLYVPQTEIVPKEERHEIEIHCGIPGVDEELLVAGSKAKKVFDEFVNLLEREHDIYPGNYFKV